MCKNQPYYLKFDKCVVLFEGFRVVQRRVNKKTT